MGRGTIGQYGRGMDTAAKDTSGAQRATVQREEIKIMQSLYDGIVLCNTPYGTIEADNPTDRHAVIKHMLESGKTITQIRDECHYSYPSIYKHARMLGRVGKGWVNGQRRRTKS